MNGSRESEPVDRATHPEQPPGAGRFSTEEAERHAANIRPSWAPAAPGRSERNGGGPDDVARELSSIRPGSLRAKAVLLMLTTILGFVVLGGLGVLSSIEFGSPIATGGRSAATSEPARPTRTASEAAPSVAAAPAAPPPPDTPDIKADPPGTPIQLAGADLQAQLSTATASSGLERARNAGLPLSATEVSGGAHAATTAARHNAPEAPRPDALATTPVPAAVVVADPGIRDPTTSRQAPTALPTAQSPSPPPSQSRATVRAPEPAPTSAKAAKARESAQARPTARPARSPLPPVVAEPPVARIPPQVQIEIATSPEHARLFIEGRRVQNPYRGTVPGGGSLRVSARAPGYGRRTLELNLDRDRALAITLPEMRGAAARQAREAWQPDGHSRNLGAQEADPPFTSPTEREVLRLRPTY